MLIVFDYVENIDLCSKLVFLFGKVVLHQQNWTIFYGMTYHFFSGVMVNIGETDITEPSVKNYYFSKPCVKDVILVQWKGRNIDF